MTKNFALLGVGGFVAPRHLQAIRDTGNKLLAACDPSDSVGVIDQHFLDAKFFTEVERFDRFLEKKRRLSDAERVHYLSICTPNYLHDAHVRLALRVGADAICEKPTVINPWNLDQLAELESEGEGRVYTVLQLRLHPSMQALKAKLAERTTRAQIELTYVARRGPWYQISWKGDEAKSGGLALNIGVHFFDLLLWLFGDCDKAELHLRDPERWAGYLSLKNADVRWYLSTRAQDLPESSVREGKSGYRSIQVDGEELEFTTGFADLHTRVYDSILKGEGFRLETARPSLELVYRLRQAEIAGNSDAVHPAVRETP